MEFNGGFFGGTNAQCGSYFAPVAIQSASVFFSASVSGFFTAGGGITSSRSFE